MIWFDYHTYCAATRCIGDFTDVPVIEVHVRPGDCIGLDDAVATLESDKATIDGHPSVAVLRSEGPVVQ